MAYVPFSTSLLGRDASSSDEDAPEVATSDNVMHADDDTFLAAMNAKLVRLPHEEFTLAEARRCHALLNCGEWLPVNDPFIDYCRKWMNEARNDLCFYK